ncbi:helix-turn-helix domain-containing protein [Pseudogemmobacter faecipullorum]|uniref:Helix-turn-helix transcriptional regulator n=1 Tax=Pseudogemmobacter faecipullorum TaxID=2755041 RepID=A0ABS8CMM5_9RHOB|nr:helix-turn-helix transcriptional regulator [Pseudogemmobacter faecipullorum]MCB5410643.1 helix-turn-helix transcriptional regulator [Pseudogemmobacter faecipullorum]
MAESGNRAVAVPEDNWFAADVATFGDRLAGAREVAGLSQEELALRLGVRLTTLQAWEDDLAEPRGNRLQMLAGLLNVSLTWLLTAEGDGLAAPQEGDRPLPAAVSEALTELTRLSAHASALAAEVARVEKRLRQALRQG